MRKLLEELFTRFYQDVYHYLYSLSRDAALSEELASETFLEAVGSIGSFRGDADMKTWLFSIARHRWYRYLRRMRREPPAEELTDWLAAPGGTPEERYQKKELADRIRELLEEEPERTRRIVLMRLEGYSFYEIGEKVGVSENTARVIDFRAKAKIRQRLKKEGYVDG